MLLTGTSLKIKIPNQVHMPCWALAIATCHSAVIPEDIQGFFGDEVVSWVSRLASKPQRVIAQDYDDIWMLHFSSQWSATHDKTTTIDIAQIGLDWLSNALSAQLNQPLQLIHSYQHYWRYARVENSTNLQRELIADPITKLAVVGDWLYGGRVEGAYLSALRLVDQYFKN